MAEIASRVVWTLSSVSQGKVRIRNLKKYDVKSEAKVEAKNEVGGDFPVGFMDKPGALTISFEFDEIQGKQAPDWNKMWLLKEKVTLTKQIVGGARTQYTPCRVCQPDTGGDSEGEHTKSVDIIALEAKPL